MTTQLLLSLPSHSIRQIYILLLTHTSFWKCLLNRNVSSSNLPTQHHSKPFPTIMYVTKPFLIDQVQCGNCLWEPTFIPPCPDFKIERFHHYFD